MMMGNLIDPNLFNMYIVCAIVFQYTASCYEIKCGFWKLFEMTEYFKVHCTRI